MSDEDDTVDPREAEAIAEIEEAKASVQVTAFGFRPGDPLAGYTSDELMQALGRAQSREKVERMWAAAGRLPDPFARRDTPTSRQADIEAYVAACQSHLDDQVGRNGVKARDWLTVCYGLEGDDVWLNRVGYDPGPSKLPRPEWMVMDGDGPGIVWPVLDPDDRALDAKAVSFNKQMFNAQAGPWRQPGALHNQRPAFAEARSTRDADVLAEWKPEPPTPTAPVVQATTAEQIIAMVAENQRMADKINGRSGWMGDPQPDPADLDTWTPQPDEAPRPVTDTTVVLCRDQADAAVITAAGWRGVAVLGDYDNPATAARIARRYRGDQIVVATGEGGEQLAQWLTNGVATSTDAEVTLLDLPGGHQSVASWARQTSDRFAGDLAAWMALSDQAPVVTPPAPPPVPEPEREQSKQRSSRALRLVR